MFDLAYSSRAAHPAGAAPTEQPDRRLGLRFGTTVAASLVALAAMPLLAIALRLAAAQLTAGGPSLPSHAATLTAAVLAVVALAGLTTTGRRALALSLAGGVIVAAIALVLGAGPAFFAVPLAACLGLAVAGRLVQPLSFSPPGSSTRNPAESYPAAPVVRAALGRQVQQALLEPAAAGPLGGRLRHHWRGLLWGVLCALAVLQTARLATWIHDPATDFVLATRHPFWYQHQCLPAYLFGAELAERGEPNLYHASHYPALDPQAAPQSQIAGLRVDDPYQYPPQFLLLPQAALALTHDVDLLRSGWFAAQFALFAAAHLALASWIGGALGARLKQLFPLLLLAFPLLYNFQFGQFHLAAVSLAILAMRAFARARPLAGGLLLATAIFAKVFPAVLLPYLAAQRRWRDLAATAAVAVVWTGVAVGLLGTAPFQAFFDYHLPRLGNGDAFAFDLAWPELAELVVADNQGAFGLARKLGFERSQAAWFGRVFGLGILVLAAWAGWRGQQVSRWARGVTWIALLCLASLASPGAWGDYVPATAVWLLALLLPVAKSAAWRALMLASLPFQAFLLGTFPLADGIAMSSLLPLSVLGVVLMVALAGGVLLHLEDLTRSTERRREEPTEGRWAAAA
jgi:alpha-1,2-mannosyltransferase